MNLTEYEALWKRALIEGEEVSSELGVPAKRLTMYKRFVWNHYEGALKKMFRRLDKLLSPDWSKWAQEYFRSYPPKAHDLNELCVSFPDFLVQRVEIGEAPEFAVELAQYELAEFFVYKSPHETLSTGEGLLRLNPAHEVLVLQFDVSSWVAQWEREKNIPTSPPVSRPNVLFVSRQIDGELCQFTQLSMIGIHMVQILEDGPQNPQELMERAWSHLSDVPGLSKDLMRKELEFLKNQSVIF